MLLELRRGQVELDVAPLESPAEAVACDLERRLVERARHRLQLNEELVLLLAAVRERLDE